MIHQSLQNFSPDEQQLIIAIARGVPVSDSLSAYGISQDDYYELCLNPNFNDAIQAISNEFKQQNSRQAEQGITAFMAANKVRLPLYIYNR